MNGQPAAAGLRLEQLLDTFNLTTAASEIVPRLTAAGHDELLPLLVDIFELERQERDKRRIDRPTPRLNRAAPLARRRAVRPGSVTASEERGESGGDEYQ